MSLPVVIRDDDTSYFTKPEYLEVAYRPLWERDLSVCLSVIPAHYSSDLVGHHGRPMDSRLEATSRIAKHRKHQLILDNHSLCRYINSLIASNLIEVALHGFSHKSKEFHDRDMEVKNLVAAGTSILSLAFHGLVPSVFIAPYDVLSLAGLRTVLEFGYDVCVPMLTLNQEGIFEAVGPEISSVELSQVCSCIHIYDRVVLTSDRFFFYKSLGAQGSLKNAIKAVDEALESSSPFYICTNHYWQFFEYGAHVLGAWHDFLDYLCENPHIEIVKFSDLIPTLKNKNSTALNM